jgi:hypothetical protein
MMRKHLAADLEIRHVERH